MFKHTKRALVTTALAAALGGFSVSANALVTELIDFDVDGPQGGFGTQKVTNFDWSPGNIVARDCLPVSALAQEDNCTIYMQTTLTGFKDFNGFNVPFDTAGDEFTMFMKVRAIAELDGDTIRWKHVKDDDNIFEIWFDDNSIALDGTKRGNPLSGEGFRDGTLILSGEPTLIDFFFEQDVDDPLVQLDKAGIDNHPFKSTIQGGGDAKFEVDIRSADHVIDTDFFKGDFVTQVDTLVMDIVDSGKAADPFTQVNPSIKIDAGGADEFTPDYGDFTTVDVDLNGDGDTLDPGETGLSRFVNDFDCDDRAGPFPGPAKLCDFHMEGDASSAFRHINEVPEPTSLALLGLAMGLLGVTGMRRRRK